MAGYGSARRLLMSGVSGFDAEVQPLDDDWDDIEGPPRSVAALAVVLGVLSLAAALVFNGSMCWSGWALGFAAIMAGVAYRVLIRRRQMHPGFAPDYYVDRAMLVGVALGFAGLVWCAYEIAQR